VSSFKRSSETGKDVRDKIFIYGPTHTSKTHASLGWPDPAIVDVENRAGHFADRFDFGHAQPRTMDDILTTLDELRAGTIPCGTFIIDGYSVIYDKLRIAHTQVTEKTVAGIIKRTAIIDNVSVNRRIAPVREFIFSTVAQHLVVTAHAQQKYDFVGENNLRARDRQEFLGDDKFRFAFDYIFRAEATGAAVGGHDPRLHPIKFIVEKSASPRLKIGDAIVVKPTESLYVKFKERTAPGSPVRGNSSDDGNAVTFREKAVTDNRREAQTADESQGQDPPSQAIQNDLQPATGKQLTRIGELQRDGRMNNGDVALVVMQVTNRRTEQRMDLNFTEATAVIDKLQERVHAVAP
jgi:hypothetical protein